MTLSCLLHGPSRLNRLPDMGAFLQATNCDFNSEQKLSSWVMFRSFISTLGQSALGKKVLLGWLASLSEHHVSKQTGAAAGLRLVHDVVHDVVQSCPFPLKPCKCNNMFTWISHRLPQIHSTFFFKPVQ